MKANSMSKRLFFISLIALMVFATLEGKLLYQTLINYKFYFQKAKDQQMRSFPLKSERGFFLDTNYKKLNENEATMSLYAIPYQIKNKDETSSLLSPILNVDKNEIYSIINKNESVISFPLSYSHLNSEQILKIQKLKLDGIYLVNDYKRRYPYSPYLSSLIGFVGKDNQGLSGLESKYDEYLKGKKGYLNYYVDAKGGLLNNYKSEIISPLKGFNLRLTLNLDLQNILERELDYAYYTYNAKEVMGIILNPNNGKILAISNRPNYDNNNYQDYEPSIYNKLLPINSSFEPGSTFKSFSFASAIENKLIDIFKDTYYDKGYEVVSGARIKSWKKGGHGLQTYLEVLQNSSNPGFVSIARKLGKDRIYKFVEDFGFLEKTGVDIQGENKGIFFKYDNFKELEQATTCFGQGISVTALQLVTAFSSLINGGNLYKPYIVEDILSPYLNESVYHFDKVLKRKTISEETSSLMRYALECVVSKGTGRKAYVEGYRVGGKTGTSQVAENGKYVDGKYILSFLAGAPMDKPEIVVYFNIKEAKNTIQYGGTTVGPIVARIIQDSLKALNVKKRKSDIEHPLTWMDKKVYAVDNYIGLEKNKVKSSYFTFVFKGNGNKVIDQLPRVGTLLETGSTILIQLG